MFSSEIWLEMVGKQSLNVFNYLESLEYVLLDDLLVDILTVRYCEYDPYGNLTYIEGTCRPVPEPVEEVLSYLSLSVCLSVCLCTYLSRSL